MSGQMSESNEVRIVGRRRHVPGWAVDHIAVANSATQMLCGRSAKGASLIVTPVRGRAFGKFLCSTCRRILLRRIEAAEAEIARARKLTRPDEE